MSKKLKEYAAASGSDPRIVALFEEVHATLATLQALKGSAKTPEKPASEAKKSSGRSSQKNS